MLTTREGNLVYPANAAMRTAVRKDCACRSCKHLGDLCQQLQRNYAQQGVFRFVVSCDGKEPTAVNE